ncbi:hypothetical protein SeMB42_g00417 [Synchytrium endobioticum]|uniref:SGNH hydrolase-type esterase domain-containing protein n=1 Tax=Synchytrium endobioticum TaxID=286115 RepID=A0A507DR76_9FUNG|nr:hypothetical protein SeLEV6574_g02568 [Synchytrium endobioticum]TPX54203.1 hypothetical protein SeMB42_g00417 [Synchytrium endobioticum]
MIDSIRLYQPGSKILLITPPPVYLPKWGAHRNEQKRSQDRDVDETKRYRECILKLAAAVQIPVLDMWKVFFGSDGAYKESIAADPDMLCDGLHLGPKGNDLLTQSFMELVAKEWPELRPDLLDEKVPWWDKVDAGSSDSIVQSLFNRSK